MKQSFEEYLRDEVWCDDGVLDDDISDSFDTWLSELDGQEYMDYADAFASKMYHKGFRDSIIALNEAIEPLTQEDDEQLTRDKRQEDAEQAMRSDYETGLLDY